VRGPHRAAVADGQVVHGGARSLRIDAAGTGREFTAVSRVIPVDEVRGKKVRLVAWLRTEELDGQLGLWLRADGEVSGRPVAFGGTHATPLRGTTDWVRGEAAVEVPETASAFVLGAFVAGAGTAWIDDVEIAVTGSVAGRPVTVHGRVVDAAGAPAAGAAVAAVSPTSAHPATVVTAGADGRFTFEVAGGRWAFTATSPAGAAYADVRDVDGTAPVDLALADGGITVRATVRVDGPPPADLRVLATRISTFEGDIFGRRRRRRRHRHPPPADRRQLPARGRRRRRDGRAAGDRRRRRPRDRPARQRRSAGPRRRRRLAARRGLPTRRRRARPRHRRSAAAVRRDRRRAPDRARRGLARHPRVLPAQAAAPAERAQAAGASRPTSARRSATPSAVSRRDSPRWRRRGHSGPP
jgi:hypothetical protein